MKVETFGSCPPENKRNTGPGATATETITR
jgi:hypothetical protein